MHAVRKINSQSIRALPLSVLMLGLAVVGTGLTPACKAPAATETSTKDIPPVYVVVSTNNLGGNEVEYSYTVVNGGAIPISAIAIGESLYGSQLLSWPTGADEDSIPPEAYSSPTGWTFSYVTTEEQATKHLYWERTDLSHEILGGQSLSGFAVRLPNSDALFQTCSWTAYLTNGEEYECVLQSSPVTVPLSSIESHDGVELTPNPGSSGTGVRYYSPNAAHGAIDVFDVRGRLVVRLFDGGVAAGWNRVEWNGLDGSGKAAPSGVYFVKIEAGTRLRFARFVLVR